ncbi:MAG: hypothetical protein NTU61_02250 [Candidatus Altiarchaeota archaeon]|nr:hypothetical protein [Candidatus Altiarchaeota archaeon]
MASGKPKKPGLLGGIPFGSVFDFIDGAGSFLLNYLSRRYEVDRKVEELKADARQQVEKLRKDAIEAGYALKKAFFRAVVEAVFLTTGLLALIIGVIMVLSDVVPLKWVLLGYGVIVTAFIAFQLKTK